MQHLLVYITAPSPDEARALAKTLVQERLAACATCLDAAQSIYWWKGELKSATETICLLKTTQERFTALEARARALHPYETPCIVALPLVAGSLPFLLWLEQETQIHSAPSNNSKVTMR